MPRLRRRPTLRERFWSRVDWSGGASACWRWTGPLVSGYGVLRGSDGRSDKAHRVAYQIAHGGPRIPSWLSACHSCDHTWCVNPAHIWLGSTLDNCHDMYRKGRDAHGVGGPDWVPPPIGRRDRGAAARMRRLRARRKAQHLGVTMFERAVTV